MVFNISLIIKLYIFRKCIHCHQLSEAKKKLDICKLPEILIIHLKRFEFSNFFKYFN